MSLKKDFNLTTKLTSIEELTDSEMEEKDLIFQQDKIILAKEKRNDLLKKSDWTQVADAPVDQEAWAAYRQALRDLPSQEGFPNEVTWPTEPVEAVVAEEPVEEVAPE